MAALYSVAFCFLFQPGAADRGELHQSGIKQHVYVLGASGFALVDGAAAWLESMGGFCISLDWASHSHAAGHGTPSKRSA